jgi:hypothetical protein
LGPNYTQEPHTDTSPLSHGTAVAGIIGATARNLKGVAGVDWSTLLYSVKVFDGNHNAAASDIADAIDWLKTQPVMIANLSFSGPDWSDAIYLATRNTALTGRLLVASMGDENSSAPRYPAAHSYTVFSVGALWGDGTRWQDGQITQCSPGLGSSFGNWIDVSAPGGRAIATSKRTGLYYDLDPRPPQVSSWCQADGFGGTSAATAHVTGLAALIRQAQPSWEVILEGDDVEKIIEFTALGNEINPNEPWNPQTGYDMIRADEALRLVTWPNAVEQLKDETLVQVGSPQEDFVLLYHVPGLNDGQYRVFRYQLHGEFTYTHDFSSTPSTWYRMSETNGWDNFGTSMFWEQEPPSVARREISQPSISTWRTYVYDVYTWPGNVSKGWFPCSPSEASIAITAIARDSAVEVLDNELSIATPSITTMPNPSSGTTWFHFQLPQQASAQIRVYDLSGRLVRTLVDETLSPGSHYIQWDCRNGRGHQVARGVYYYQLNVNGQSVMRQKLVLTR